MRVLVEHVFVLDELISLKGRGGAAVPRPHPYRRPGPTLIFAIRVVKLLSVEVMVWAEGVVDRRNPQQKHSENQMLGYRVPLLLAYIVCSVLALFCHCGSFSFCVLTSPVQTGWKIIDYLASIRWVTSPGESESLISLLAQGPYSSA